MPAKKIRAKKSRVEKPTLPAAAPLDTHDVDTFDAAIEYLSNICNDKTTKLTPIQRRKIKIAGETIEKFASQIGLDPEQILSLVDIVSCRTLTETLSHRLITRSLIPSSVVPHMAIMSAVSWLCTNIPSATTQALLVRWILVIFNLIDDLKPLHCLYGMLFLLLDKVTMRQYICQLLVRMTQPTDVRQFRVRALLEHRKLAPSSDKDIVSLLSVYKLYAPHLVAVSVPRTTRVFFRTIDQAWSARVLQITGRNGYQSPAAVLRPTNPSLPTAAQSGTSQLSPDRGLAESLGGQWSAPSPAVPGPSGSSVSRITLPPTKKPRRDALVPVASVALDWGAVTQVGRKDAGLSGPMVIRFEQIGSLRELIRNLDIVKLPSQMAAMLQDRKLQHVLLLTRDPDLRFRLTYWLENALDTEFFRSISPDESRQEELLELIVQLTEFLQESIPVVEEFLVSFLQLWNGRSHRVHILKLITRWRLCSFRSLSERVLVPLRNLFFIGTVYLKVQCLVCLTELLRNFAQTEWPRYKYMMERTANQPTSTSIVNPPVDCLTVFATQDSEPFAALDCLTELMKFVAKLCDIGLQSENFDVLLLHSVLSFYELASSLFKNYRVPVTCIPSRTVIYGGVLHRNAFFVSRVCSLLCSYRDMYTIMRAATFDDDLERAARNQTTTDCVAPLNAYMIEITDMLWKCDSKTLDSMPVKDIPFAKYGLSVYMHPALIPYAHQFLNETQPPNTKFHPISIKKCKDLFLEYLAKNHSLDGFQQFVKQCIRRGGSSGSTAPSRPYSKQQHLSTNINPSTPPLTTNLDYCNKQPVL